ncbi:MAG: hypothetical protein ACK5RG_20620 [Cyclobacteriaceae bacterium]|jgi:hypothetical protein
MKLTLMAFVVGLCAGVLLQKTFAIQDAKMKTARANNRSIKLFLR